MLFRIDRLIVYTFDPDAPSEPIPDGEYLCSLLPPAPLEEFDGFAFQALATKCTACGSEEPPVPFQLPAENNIFLASLIDFHGGQDYCLFVPCATIRSCVAQCGTQRKHNFTWEEWGSLGFRLLQPGGYNLNLMCVLGNKAILGYHLPSRLDSQRPYALELNLFDFSPGANRQVSGDAEKRAATTMIVDRPTSSMPSSSAFRDPVTRYLPHRRTRRMLYVDGWIATILMMPDGLVIYQDNVNEGTVLTV